MEQKIFELDGNQNYLLQAENDYNKVVERFDLKTKDYFDALRELRDNYNKEYDILTVKSNQLIYGNSEGKIERKYRDRSDLYIKVVKRSKKYKTWKNFFTAIGAAAVFIMLIQVLCYFFNIRTSFISAGFEIFSDIVLLTAAWSGFIFDSVIFFKSLKYFTVQPLNTKEERKWLNLYFKNIGDIISAKAYLEVLVQREEMVEKYLNASDSYIEALDVKSKVISKMKKDVEKVMDDFMYDGEVSTALEHVLESWKDY